MDIKATAEYQRLRDPQWKRWGTYVGERQWGTQRENFSADKTAWEYFPFEDAARRVYRWGEDAIAGFCDTQQRLCLGVALWNGHDPILKERFFGLSNEQGNHGEDVKEYYFYLDGLPSHAYMKMLYRYPQVAYPYDDLIRENKKRGFDQPEYELYDAIRAAFDQHRYFDVFIEYAKTAPDDVYCRITAINRGDQAATLHILPQMWYRNTWITGECPRPVLKARVANGVRGEEEHLGTHWWYVEADQQTPRLLFTENENDRKDGIQAAVIGGDMARVNANRQGSKCAAHFTTEIAPGAEFVVKVRFSPAAQDTPFTHFDSIFQQRIAEADAFYTAIQPQDINADESQVQRRAFAGLLWSKQFYHYDVHTMLQGDKQHKVKKPTQHNKNWQHFSAMEVISVPDKWEYPWFAAWDIVFQALTLGIIDPHLAKDQLLLLLQERYTNRDGQIPAYEGEFSQHNPPIHAWGAWQVYHSEGELYGESDLDFLEKAFHKLVANFSAWFKGYDDLGRDLIEGGFLGMDNISAFNRTLPPKEIKHIEQADAVGWMNLYCLNMLRIALELAKHNRNYEFIATRYFEHFVYLANLFYNHPDAPMWEDGFFYDVLHFNSKKKPEALRIRSYAGMIPFLAVEMFNPGWLEQFPFLRERAEALQKDRPDLWVNIAPFTPLGANGCHQLSVLNKDRLARFLQRMLDNTEFLSEYGLRSVSKVHAEQPVTYKDNKLSYAPGESQDNMFGGNSNWRGPIWSPINQMIIDALLRYHSYYGDEFKVELPRGSGNWITLKAAAQDLAARVIALFLRDEKGERPFWGQHPLFRNDPHWRDHILFYEYFHGEHGEGLGASHQNGWTSLVAKLIHDKAKHS